MTLSSPHVDVIENSNGVLVIKCDIPGCRKEDVNVSCHDGNLTILATKEEEKLVHDPQGGVHVWHVERVRGGFFRILSVSKDIETRDITCHVLDGVLTIVIPQRLKGDTGKAPRSGHTITVEAGMGTGN